MSYIRYPLTGGGGATKYATAGDLPASAADGDLAIVLDTDLLYVYNGASWVIIGGPGAAITVSDSNSVDLTLAANDLTADLNLSAAAADAGNFNAITSIETDGLQVQVANSSVQAAISVSDTNSIDLTYSSGAISGDLRLSAAAADVGYFNAAVTIEADGLQVQVANADIGLTFVPYTGATGNVNLGSNTLTVGELIDSGLTANTVPYANGSKQLTSSAVTPTELGYVSGVTSSIQNQLNGKQATLTFGNLTESTSSILTITGGTGAVIGTGTSIQVSQATTSTSGYLSSADWNTFNNKQTATLADGNVWIGNGSNVATAVTLTGDVTTTNAGVTAIGANKVTNSMLATVATATFKGRTTAGTGNVEDLTATQATALLNAFVGDSGSGGTKGLVPAPSSGDAAANKFLKADGTWATVSAASGGGFTTYANENISASGTVSLSTTVMLQYRRITGNGAAVTASSTPLGTSDPTDGTIVRLVGQSNTNTVTFTNNDAGSGFILNGPATLGQYNVLEMQYDSTADRWIEISRNF